jgi:SAM-dependent methyltransferase
MGLHTPGAEDSAVAASPAGVGPDRIFEIATGFMATKLLFAASELGVFEALAVGPASLDDLAARAGLSRRSARICADAMVALGLLERDGDLYRNGQTAATFLSGSGPADMRPFLRFWDQISYPAWEGLAGTLRSGPRPPLEFDEATQKVFSAGVAAIQAGPAQALAATYDFAAHQRLLDVGGGDGTWSAQVARLHGHMRATILDLPAVATIARQRLAAEGLTERVDAVGADVLVDPFPRGHDVILVANLVHYWAPETNRELLQRLRTAVDAGARLLLVDFWTDPTHTQPLMAALMAGEFAVIAGAGDVYSVDEARQWLEPAAWRFVDHVALVGPMSLIVAEAV